MFVKAGSSVFTLCLISSRCFDHYGDDGGDGDDGDDGDGYNDNDDNDPQFDPEALHMCTKLSGVAAQYTRYSLRFN